MSADHPTLESLFLAALEIASPEKQAVFLESACGSDQELRQEVEKLLQSHRNAGSFLQHPVVEQEATLVPTSSDQDLAAVLDAGLSPAFQNDQVVVIGHAGNSVLKSFGKDFNAPQVALREPNAPGDEPIVKPKSPEMPDRNSDSRYQLQGEIARGGMGAIIKGRDTDLGRELAIKVLLDVHKDKPEVIQRFIEEAQIGGQLQHPGIAPVYELGKFSDRRPFFSMKLVKGETLSKLLSERKDPAEDRGRFLGVFEQICQTMAYAHSRGVIHRDLKPANIMVGAFGEVQVMDWGLAKVLPAGGVADEKKAQDKQQGQSIIQTLRTGTGSDLPGAIGSVGSQTQMGSIMGTPAYMPPEQALGEIDNLDERADVFGLGAILCEILTGKPPYYGDEGTKVFRMAARGKLEECFERLAVCGADAELIALTKHCLELEPADRPRDAGVLADRVSGYLASVETKLRQTELERATEAARVVELHRRRKLHYAIAAMLLMGLLIAGLAANHFRIMEGTQRELATRNSELAAEREKQRVAADRARSAETRQRELAEAARTQAEAERDRADTTLADMQTSRGLQAAKDNEPAQAALWFANAALTTPRDPVRSSANQLRARNWLSQAVVPVAMLNIKSQNLRRLSFQPNGSLALTLSNNSLQIWDWRYERTLSWSESLNDIVDADWSPDGQQLALVTTAGRVRIVDPSNGEVRIQFSPAHEADLLCWSPDGQRLACASKSVQIWELKDSPELQHEWPHPDVVFGMSFNRAGTRLATACMDEQARVFAANDETRPAPMLTLDHQVDPRATPLVNQQAPVFCDGDRRLVVIARDMQPRWYDAETGQNEPRVWTEATSPCNRGLTVSADGQKVAVAGYRSSLVWNVTGGSQEFKHRNMVTQVNFHPSGSWLLTNCWDLSSNLFPIPAAGRPPHVIPQLNIMACSAFSSDGEQAAISGGQQVVIWQLPRQESIIGHVSSWKCRPHRPRPSFDGRLVTPGHWHETPHTFPPLEQDLTVALMSNGEPAGATISLGCELVDSCVCADNRSVAAACKTGETGVLKIFDIASGRNVITAIELPAVPLSIAARPELPQVAVLCADGHLYVFNTTSGSQLQEWTHAGWNQNAVWSGPRVRYSPDGKLLVSLSMNQKIFVRDADEGTLKFPPLSPILEGGPIRSLVFSSDSRLLAVAVNGKNAVGVWDLATGAMAASPLLHPGDSFGIFSIAFSPDNRHILSSHKDGLLRLWDWKAGQLVVPPMQHPDEVYDCCFVGDGQYAVAAVRLNGLYVWHLASGKLAAPPVQYPIDSDADTAAIGASQMLIVASAKDYPVIDVSHLIANSQADVFQLQRQAELATNQKLELGELGTLTRADWDERWTQFIAARANPAEELELLSRAYEAAEDDAAREKIARRAQRFNLLESLVDRFPDATLMQLHLAADLDRRGEKQAASEYQNRAITSLLKSAPISGIDAPMARRISLALVPDIPEIEFASLIPIELKTDSGATISQQADESIKVGAAATPRGDMYTIRGRTSLRRINCLRLDVMPDQSLPAGGSGLHESGNFHLTEVRAELRRGSGETIPIKFATAFSSYLRRTDYFTTSDRDGAAGAIDHDPLTRWDVGYVYNQPHFLTLETDTPLDMGDGDELIVFLEFRDPRIPTANLGCFRLSAGYDELSLIHRQLAIAVQNSVLNENDALKAALLLARRSEAQKFLQPSVADESNDPMHLMLQGILLLEQGDEQKAEEIALRLLELLKVQTPEKRTLEPLFVFLNKVHGSARTPFYQLLETSENERELARMNAALQADPDSAELRTMRVKFFSRLGRWQESAEAYSSLAQLEPDTPRTLVGLAGSLVLAGDQEGYQRVCRELQDRHRDSNAAWIAEIRCRNCLMSSSMIPVEQLPTELLRTATLELALEDGYRPWFIACNALVFYRQGKPVEAIEWANKLPEKSWCYGALALTVRAMSEEQLGQHEQAVKTLEEAEFLIPIELRILGTPDYTSVLPVYPYLVEFDWLPCEILRREAHQLIHRQP